ncbi:IS3 family transposase, partial [Streptomyces mirabilis]|uniref:IS3 family transposase n=1 Tax=Streptomyces mirabilis TaxID=68239 RepID=UPI0033E7DF45
ERSTESSSPKPPWQTARNQPETPLDIHRGINAVSEAFNSVLKVEYVHWHTFRTRTETRIKIATWITDFYNVRRLHGVCGFKSPIDYERDYRANPRRGTGRIDRLHAARGVGMSSSPCTEAKRLV